MVIDNLNLNFRAIFNSKKFEKLWIFQSKTILRQKTRISGYARFLEGLES